MRPVVVVVKEKTRRHWISKTAIALVISAIVVASQFLIPTPFTFDGHRFGGETVETRLRFHAVYGADAAWQWNREHNIETLEYIIRYRQPEV